jgi:hypothetical protein
MSQSEGEFGCRACWPASADAAWAARSTLARTNELIDDSHLIVALLACPSCGQQFVSIFVEEIDWVDGDDPQRWMLLPVTDAEARDLARTGEASVESSVWRLAGGRRSLHRDSPKGGPIVVSWRPGGGVSHDR